MSNEHENGVAAEEQALVQVEPETGLYWYCTDAMPLPPPSVGVEASVTEAVRFAASAVKVTLGSVLSIRREVTASDAPEMPTLSIGTARKS